jgi:hypothetical protein
LTTEKYQGILAWESNGLSFVIKDLREFRRVLPLYFKTNNYASFIRQLNMYGFRKDRGDKNCDHFSHPKFLKGNLVLIQDIRRRSGENNKLKGAE